MGNDAIKMLPQFKKINTYQNDQKKKCIYLAFYSLIIFQEFQNRSFVFNFIASIQSKLMLAI